MKRRDYFGFMEDSASQYYNFEILGKEPHRAVLSVYPRVR